jgi:hypothetical protein
MIEVKRAVLALVLGSLVVFASVAHAGPKTYSPTLKVSFGEAALTTDGATTPTSYVVNGCGYDRNYGGVTIVVHSPEAISFAGQVPDSDGCIWVTNFSTQGAGHYQIDAWQHVRNKDKVVASTSFDW